mmetsp:Transcript_3135/g.9568  ORF Transcript_3135/g.9568 Transcript_3135/m.9568 type:complete len:280 (+) Transcript_3135:627-1466(+)
MCRVAQHLLLIGLEVGRHRLLECHSQTSNCVVVRSTLQTGEDRLVDRVLIVIHDFLSRLGICLLHALSVEYHGAPWPSKGLVCCGGDHISVFERTRNYTGGDQAGDVCHVRQEDCVVLVGDLTHASVIVVAGVGACASNDELRAIHFCVFLELIVVNVTSRLVQPVRHRLEEDGGGRDPLLIGHKPVRKMAAVWQVESHEAVMWFQQPSIHGHVCRGARERLNVYSPLARVQPIGLESTLHAQTFCHVNKLIATVITGARISLGVLVRHWRTDSLHHSQ